MSVRPILLFGHPALRERAVEVVPGDADLTGDIAALSATLADFRQRNGWGRAIAANQIGIVKRLVVVDFGDGPRALLNPRVTWADEEETEYWDDCFSLPGVLARVRRPSSITIRYQDEAFAERAMEHLPWSEAELIHHEIDHLDGVLMVDRLVDPRFIVARAMRSEADLWIQQQKDVP